MEDGPEEGILAGAFWRPAIDFTRALPRLKRNLPFHLPDGWRGEVVDLSATGLRLQSIAVLEKDTLIEGELELGEGERLTLKCEVVWANPPDHAGFVPAEMGLAILNPPPEYIDALARLFAHTE